MTMTRRPEEADETRDVEHGSHVPADGTAGAAAIEQARKDMLHEARPLNRTRIGADVVCEALLRQGVDVFFGYPGGVVLPLYDVLGDYPELRHVLVRHEQGGAHAADGYARVDRPGRRLPRDERPGRDEPRHRHRHGAARLDPDGRDHRQRARRADRQGRLPGDRHQRHHAADDQAQLPGPRCGRAPARLRRGVPHRPVRPARARSTSTSRRTPSSRRRGPSTPPRRRSSPACPASGRTWTATRASSSWPPPRSPAAKRPVILAGHGVLHARGLGRPARLRREGPDPGRPHAARRRRHLRGPSAQLRLHGHARLEARQPGDPERPTC